MESIKAGTMGRGSATALYGDPLEQHREQHQEISTTARRRMLAGSRRLWTREEGFTLAGSRGV